MWGNFAIFQIIEVKRNWKSGIKCYYWRHRPCISVSSSSPSCDICDPSLLYFPASLLTLTYPDCPDLSNIFWNIFHWTAVFNQKHLLRIYNEKSFVFPLFSSLVPLTFKSSSPIFSTKSIPWSTLIRKSYLQQSQNHLLSLPSSSYYILILQAMSGLDKISTWTSLLLGRFSDGGIEFEPTHDTSSINSVKPDSRTYHYCRKCDAKFYSYRKFYQHLKIFHCRYN